MSPSLHVPRVPPLCTCFDIYPLFFNICFYLFIQLCQFLVAELRIFSCGMKTLSCGLWYLVPWPEVEPRLPALGARSLSHWTPGKSLEIYPLYEDTSHSRLGPTLLHYVLSSVQFSRSVVSDSLRPYGLQHARPPCPSPTPGVYSDSCLLSLCPHCVRMSSYELIPSAMTLFPLKFMSGSGEG